jgi:hypothetical protein
MHLIAVQHGLWGKPANTAELCRVLGERLGEEHDVINCDRSPGHATYDGVDVCGDR